MATSEQSKVEAAFGNCRSALWGVASISLVINLLMLTGPLFMLQVYDRVLTGRSVATLIALTAIMIILYVFFGVLDAVRTKSLMRIGRKFTWSIEKISFITSTCLPSGLDAKNKRTQEPVSELERIGRFLSSPGPGAIFDLPWLPFYLGIIFLFHPLLGFVALAGAFIMCVLIGLNELSTRKYSERVSGLAVQRRIMLEDTRRHGEAAIAMGMLGGLASKWNQLTEQLAGQQEANTTLGANFSALTKTFRFFLQSSVLAIGAYLALLQEITAGMIIAATVLTSRAMSPIEQAITHWRSFVSARLAYKNLQSILDSSSEQDKTDLPSPNSSLSLEDVVVRAPDFEQAIVNRVSFKLSRGDVLGVIGPSASGKSSLARAIVGVWPTAQGKIKLDGAELAQWHQSELGRHIGYLPQDIQLFQGSVAENIVRFKDDVRTETMIEAAQLAGAHELILDLPNGYDTKVGIGGVALSGGQRQRIAFARALYGEPFLIVLDEPNSNLDADGEAALTKAILELKQRGKIVIVIAHRPSAITAVDQLAVLREGNLVAFGPKSDVLKASMSKTA
ncbi:type I secretion system permease/ATPase [Neiella marina]|uniref:Type I secretion system permease/ATPase n=1 Tax=Neiella holothuriorum TaxID=2870530 RepID=A0ABS7EE69_9GAMM|nr:type I secretion system permease/ATPase [Neiella holothuriorum]MBW8190641.1 type I secretion system permease/ATPase [Neiella holothuriorum]